MYLLKQAFVVKSSSVDIDNIVILISNDLPNGHKLYLIANIAKIEERFF